VLGIHLLNLPVAALTAVARLPDALDRLLIFTDVL
jgi:hypothetical protein